MLSNLVTRTVAQLPTGTRRVELRSVLEVSSYKSRAMELFVTSYVAKSFYIGLKNLKVKNLRNTESRIANWPIVQVVFTVTFRDFRESE